MRTILALAAFALLLPAAANAQENGPEYGQRSSNSNIVPAKPKSRDLEPISRKDFDRAVEKLFREADSDRDGQITLAEFNAGIEARKVRVIADRFAAIDTNHNKTIDVAEFGAWQRAMGSAALSDAASAGTPLSELVGEELALDDERGFREDRVLVRAVAPLNSVVLASANTDYDGGTTLAELLAFEGKRFDGADTNKDGWLTVDESEPFLPHDGVQGTAGVPPAG